MQRFHHENMNRISHPSVDGRGALLHEWARWFHACKWRLDTQTHPSPPLICEKMWMRKWELKMKRHSPSSILPAWIPVLSSSCSNQIRARHSRDATISPPTQHTHGFHTYTHLTCAHTSSPHIHVHCRPRLHHIYCLFACIYHYVTNTRFIQREDLSSILLFLRRLQTYRNSLV